MRRLAAPGLVALLGGLALYSAWNWLVPDPLAAGRAAYDRQAYARAADIARTALKAEPESAEARQLLARSWGRLGRHQYAQGLFDRVPREQLRAEDYFVIGSGLIRQGQAPMAGRLFEMALKDDPDHAEALAQLAGMYAALDRLAEADALADRLAKQPGWEVRAAVVQGVIAHDEEDPARAAAALQRALEAEPSLTGAVLRPEEARLVLARDLLKQGRPDAAQRAIDEVLRPGPGAEAWWLASRVALQKGDRAAFERAVARAGPVPAASPQDFEPAPYVGAARCAGCHADIHRIQQGGRHAKTFRDARGLHDAIELPERPLPDPHDPEVVHTLGREGDRAILETRVGGQSVRAWIDFAVGSGDRGLTPVGHDEQGRPRELRLSYYGDIRGWDCTTGHPNAAELTEAHDFLGPTLGADAIRRCVGCHATYHVEARSGNGPTSADRGIGCERCHGPGGNHLAAVALKLSDLAIGRPRAVDPAASTRLCAQCHSPKGRPVLSPEDEIRFQALTLPRSRCYTESAGAFGCVTCHNPHRDADTDPGYYEAKCLACHGPAGTQPDPGAPPADDDRPRVVALPPDSRRTSCPVEPRANCLECHMPQAKGQIPHTVFTDHHIRVRRGPATVGE
jgi:tetratricopeptide (TPR) repeat protein